MNDALIWLFAIEVLGLIAFPFVFVLFRRLPDRGFAFAKPLALLLGAYLLWILGLAHILPNSRPTIIAIVIVLAVISALMARSCWREMRSFLYEQRYPLLIAELIFLGFYFMWLAVISGAPAINHTEKPMDFAFLNAILQSSYFPPEDPWLAGHSISYYYFGHFMMAFITKLTAIPSSISYNLSIALIPAMVGAGAFSLVYSLIRLSGASLKRAVVFALAAPLFLVMIGNLEGILEFVNARGWGSDGFWQWISIKGLDGSQTADAGLFPDSHWWWWRATRVIDTVVDGASLDYTITEFPFFSFLLGDLHPHVTALPFVLMTLALGLNFFIDRQKIGWSWIRSNPWEIAALTLVLGSLAFINIWDYPIFAVMIIILVLVKSYGDWTDNRWRVYGSALLVLLPVLIGSIVLFLPFYVTLESQASGVSPLGDFSTRPLFFFLILALFLVICGTFLIRQLWDSSILKTRDPLHLSVIVMFTILPFLIWAAIEVLGLWVGIELPDRFRGDSFVDEIGDVGFRFIKLLPAMAIVVIAAYSMLVRVRRGGDQVVAFVLLPMAMAFYLLMGAELFFIIDLFGNRMNTVFKVYYQSWILLGIVAAYGIYYVVSHPTRPGATFERLSWRPAKFLTRKAAYAWPIVVLLLVAASVYYPVGAALSRSGELGTGTLDGLDFLRPSNSGEYEAIVWLRDEAPKGRLVEAVGGDYTDFGRISASTGLPTLLGWKFHERQWRGSSAPFAGREEQVDQIYRSSDPVHVAQLLDDGEVRYVYVGIREQRTYGAEHLAEFTSFLQPVFEPDGVVIYEVLPPGERSIVEGIDAGTSQNPTG